MAYLKIKNRKDFVSNFLSPVSNLNEQCIVKLTSDKLTCILASSDATIVCKADIDIESDVTGEVNLNIPDIKKFIRVLEILSDENIELKLNNNEKKEFNHSVKAVKSLTTLSNKLLNKKNKK